MARYTEGITMFLELANDPSKWKGVIIYNDKLKISFEPNSKISGAASFGWTSKTMYFKPEELAKFNINRRVIVMLWTLARSLYNNDTETDLAVFHALFEDGRIEKKDVIKEFIDYLPKTLHSQKRIEEITNYIQDFKTTKA